MRAALSRGNGRCGVTSAAGVTEARDRCSAFMIAPAKCNETRGSNTNHVPPTMTGDQDSRRHRTTKGEGTQIKITEDSRDRDVSSVLSPRAGMQRTVAVKLALHFRLSPQALR